MRLVMLFALAALILGGIYHTQISRYVSGVFAGTEQAGGGPGFNGIRQVGNATNGVMTRAAGALHR